MKNVFKVIGVLIIIVLLGWGFVRSVQNIDFDYVPMPASTSSADSSEISSGYENGTVSVASSHIEPSSGSSWFGNGSSSGGGWDSSPSHSSSNSFSSPSFSSGGSWGGSGYSSSSSYSSSGSSSSGGWD